MKVDNRDRDPGTSELVTSWWGWGGGHRVSSSINAMIADGKFVKYTLIQQIDLLCQTNKYGKFVEILIAIQSTLYII